MSTTESFLAKLEKVNTRTFTLPYLQEEVKYHKMDVIQSSIDNSLPNFLAMRVLDAMKKSVTGEAIENQKVEVNDHDIRQLLERADLMWIKLVIEPKLELEQLNTVPSEDRIAWFLNAMGESQQAETKGGGKINATEVANFPDKARTRGNSKRGPNSEVL